MRITRVVVGADAVSDAAGSELVQFGPGFSCGQSEDFLPPTTTKLLPWARGASPPPHTPTYTTTINDCALGEGGLFAARKNLEDKPCSNSRASSAGGVLPRERGMNGREGQNMIIRDRPVTADRKPRSGESGPLPRPTESAHMLSLSPSLCATKTHDDPKGSVRHTKGIDGINSTGGGEKTCVDTTEIGELIARDDDDNDDDRAFCVKDKDTAAGPPSPEENDQVKPTTTQQTGTTGDEESGHMAPKLSVQIDAVNMSGSYISEDGSSNDRRGGQGGEQQHHQLLDDDCARVGHALASSGGDSSVWNDDNTYCTMLSVTTLEKASCNSSLSDGSLEQLASKRSFSSHETERYGGNLSKDATDILRSHLESESKLSDNDNGDVNASYPDSHSRSRDVMQGETAALMSPVPPPTPSDQASDIECRIYGLERWCGPGSREEGAVVSRTFAEDWLNQILVGGATVISEWSATLTIGE